MLDILIMDGLIVNGTGSQPWIGDVGIIDGRIVSLDKKSDYIPGESDGSRIAHNAIGNGEAQESEIVINAAGKVVAPGFIDMHSHSDISVLNDPTGEIKLRQGVTSEIFGNCGFSAAPFSKEFQKDFLTYSEPVLGLLKEQFSWKTYREYLHRLGEIRLGHNIGGFVGNGALRIAAKGFASSPLDAYERAKVIYMLEEALEAGALGLSLGLMYVPENFYSKDELVEICNMLKKYDAIITAHIRGEGNSLIKSIEEVLYIARKCEAPLHISHLKAAGSNNWGAVCSTAVDMIDKARSRSMDVTCDVYPYTAGSSSLASLLPPWIMEGGVQKAIERIRKPQLRKRIIQELNSEAEDWDNLVYSTGWENVVVSFAGTGANKAIAGKSMVDIAKLWGEEPAETALKLLEEEMGNVSIVFFHMSEEDVINIMKLDYSCVISDSLGSREGLPHPRMYGAFPRLFSRYVREKKVLTLEEAVRKVTLMPARRLGLVSKGKLSLGCDADIVVFDQNTICDRAAYTNPRQFPEGLEHVIVGGKQAVKSGRLTGTRNGRLISGR